MPQAVVVHRDFRLSPSLSLRRSAVPTTGATQPPDTHHTTLLLPLQVHGPFQMLNVINFIVFRITRAVLYSLEAVMAAPDTTAIVSRVCFLWGCTHVTGGSALCPDLTQRGAHAAEVQTFSRRRPLSLCLSTVCNR